ncbi:hypothetical protein AAG906_021063 [Vitis piasezkii]
MVDVPEHFHEHKISIALHNISHKVMDWTTFHRLSSRTDVIQAKIKSVKELDPFRKSSSGVASCSSAGEVPDMAYPVLNNDELVGMERRTTDLLIKEESRRLVISVVGSTGSRNKALELFFKKAFRSTECPKHLKDISDELLSRFGGLPLAIVALGSLLSTKQPTSSEFQKQDGDQARVGAELFSGIGGFYHQYRSCHLSRQTSQGNSKELGNLTAMRKLEITELERKDGKDLCASI